MSLVWRGEEKSGAEKSCRLPVRQGRAGPSLLIFAEPLASSSLISNSWQIHIFTLTLGNYALCRAGFSFPHFIYPWLICGGWQHHWDGTCMAPWPTEATQRLTVRYILAYLGEGWIWIDIWTIPGFELYRIPRWVDTRTKHRAKLWMKQVS